MLRPIAGIRPVFASVSKLVVPRCYLLRRGCAMKFRDTASTCSLLAWWLLMVLEYILGEAAFSGTRFTLACYPPLLTPTNSRRYCLAAASTERERDGLIWRQKGRWEGDEEYAKIARGELGNGFSGSRALKCIAFLEINREGQNRYAL